MLALISAVLTGLFGYFFTGSLTVQVGGIASKFGSVAIQGGGGMGLFLVTLLWWKSPRAPVVQALPQHLTDALEDSLFNNLDIYKPTESQRSVLLGTIHQDFNNFRSPDIPPARIVRFDHLG